MLKNLSAKFLLLALMGFVHVGLGQSSYRYALDLNKSGNDMLEVQLLTPQVKTSTAIFSFPKIIPGTYSISDYGKFVSGLKAFDKTGKSLKVTKQGDNQWKISGAAALAKITYMVEDIFDTKLKHNVYPMAATNIEEGKNYVLHTPGIFGFINGMNKIPFEITIAKPADFFGSTALIPASSTATQDVFRIRNLDELYDAPIMYTRPDTTTIQVGNAQVLVSVYSPNKKLHSKEIADWMSELLLATKDYLGGKLPTDRYAFLFYFRAPDANHAFPPGLGGALEHTSSSFYYMVENEPELLRNTMVDIASHEFFHIISPLTISSKEVKEFNFNEAVLSKHLWLYEGVTEYTSHHVQVKYGLNTPQEFLQKLSEKITDSRTNYNDALAFTTMSKESAGKYKDEYGNVYQKGALIGAVLDVYLLHLSEGVYGLRNLTYDLGVRYGKDRYFMDDELFDEIGKLTYPQVKDFLVKYVGGNEPIPYEYYFNLAGVKFSAKKESKSVSFGGISLGLNAAGEIFITDASKMNDFGKSMGYKQGDILYEVNGAAVMPQTFATVSDSIKKQLREGDPFIVKVGRKNSEGVVEKLTLTGKATFVTVTQNNTLEIMPEATAKQKLVRQAWLTAGKTTEAVKEYAANPADVASIDAIIKATYNVISGAQGPRNWERFYSLFLPGAKMGAVNPSPTGAMAYHSIAPAEYQKSNAPFFMQSGFFEEELGRTVSQFGQLAQVQSAYQFRFTPGGKVEQRGVNYFTLVNADGRWWIASLIWQDEDKNNPIPQNLLPR